MPQGSQRILDFGENSVFIEADPDESFNNSFWLRIGPIEQAENRLVRLTTSQARTLGWALLVHADGLDDRQKERRYPKRIAVCR